MHFERKGLILFARVLEIIFVKDIAQGYKPVIFHGLRVRDFGNKDHGCFVDFRGKVAIF